MTLVQKAILYLIVLMSICYLESVAVEKALDGPLKDRYWNRFNKPKK